MKLTVIEMARIAYQITESMERLGFGSAGWQMCCGGTWEAACGKCQRAFTRHVQRILDNPTLDARQVRELWVTKKKEAGWKFGAEKDMFLMTHPKLAEWEDLPSCDRIHHEMMHALIHALMEL